MNFLRSSKSEVVVIIAMHIVCVCVVLNDRLSLTLRIYFWFPKFGAQLPRVIGSCVCCSLIRLNYITHILFWIDATQSQPAKSKTNECWIGEVQQVLSIYNMISSSVHLFLACSCVFWFAILFLSIFIAHLIYFTCYKWAQISPCVYIIYKGKYKVQCMYVYCTSSSSWRVRAVLDHFYSNFCLDIDGIVVHIMLHSWISEKFPRLIYHLSHWDWIMWLRRTAQDFMSDRIF